MPLLAGDELFSDSYEYKEIQDGFFYEAEGKVRWLAASRRCAGRVSGSLCKMALIGCPDQCHRAGACDAQSISFLPPPWVASAGSGGRFIQLERRLMLLRCSRGVCSTQGLEERLSIERASRALATACLACRPPAEDQCVRQAPACQMGRLTARSG